MADLKIFFFLINSVFCFCSRGWFCLFVLKITLFYSKLIIYICDLGK